MELNQYLNGMQGITEFNVLIIGRSGSGKSATTKLLTSNPAIKVANSLKEVTTDVNYYEGTAFQTAGEEVRFRVLDIPGLDKINNRAYIREKILQKLQSNAIALHAIIYVSSLTERDTIDENKLFFFLEQLPWSTEQKKGALIPLLTKYDNLVIDSQEDDVNSTKKEFQDIFEKLGYGLAWGKRTYWINQTRSLQFKVKCYQEVRETYEKQVERLIEMIKKNKHLLTAKAIRDVIEKEDKFVLKRLFGELQLGLLPFKAEQKSHFIKLKVQVEPHTFEESVTAVSASSIGLFISKVCHKQISGNASLILLSVPIAVALIKLAAESLVLKSKQIGQTTSGDTIMRSYEHICAEINNEMEQEWKHLNNNLEFKTRGLFLCCHFPQQKYKFFDLTALTMSYEGVQFECLRSESTLKFRLAIPQFIEEVSWCPQIDIHYSIRKFNEEDILRNIELLRKQFCSKI